MFKQVLNTVVKTTSYYLNSQYDLCVSCMTDMSCATMNSNCIKYNDYDLSGFIEIKTDSKKYKFDRLEHVFFDTSIVNNKVIEVNAVNLGLNNLTFLNLYPNITRLNLSFNNITNLDNMPILNKLTDLSLPYNFITNIDKLSNFRNLKRLFLYCNKIDNLNCLKSLPNLEILDVSITNISDISILDEIKTLKYISIPKNCVFNTLLYKLNIFDQDGRIILTNLYTVGKFLYYNNQLYYNDITY